jgi:GTP-binding protein EngB required for normal cell division
MLENIVAFTSGALLVVAIVYIYKREKTEFINLINKLETDINILFHKTSKLTASQQTLPTNATSVETEKKA